MNDFDLRKYLAEGKLLKENIDFPELEDEFEGAMDAMVVEPEVYLQDIIKASPEEIVSDDYYEVMNAVEQGVYSEDEAVELAKAWAKEKLSTLSEGRIFEAKTIEVDGLQMYTYSPFKDKSFGVDGDKEVPMKYAGEANNLDDIMKLVSRLPDTVKELEVPYDLYFGPSLQTFKYKTLTPPFNLNEIRDMVVKVVNEEIPTRMSKAYGIEKYAKTYTLKPVGKFYYNPENAARSNEEDTAIYRLNILTN